MDAFIKLQEIAVHMDLEPAEDEPLARPGDMRLAADTTVAPCGQVVGQPPVASAAERKAADKRASLGVTQAALPNGRTIPLL